MLSHFFLSFMAFFAIMNPVSSLPVYMSLTSADDDVTAKSIGKKGLMIAFIIVCVFSLAGSYIFTMFGITIDALRIAGGLLVFMIGFHMLNGNHSPVNKGVQASNDDPTDIAISPLGTPLLAGPGTIATAINLSSSGFNAAISTIASFGLLCLITYALFRCSKQLTSMIGKSVMGVITRMMGLILAVIGVQMVIAGIKGAFDIA